MQKLKGKLTNHFLDNIPELRGLPREMQTQIWRTSRLRAIIRWQVLLTILGMFILFPLFEKLFGKGSDRLAIVLGSITIMMVYRNQILIVVREECRSL